MIHLPPFSLLWTW